MTGPAPRKPDTSRVSDFTHFATWKGFAYVVFIINAYARRIVGWQVNVSAHAGLVLDALEQTVHDRGPVKGSGLVHHSDRGSQHLSIKYTERLSEAGIEPSVDSVGNGYDSALAETISGLFKAEIIHHCGPGATSRPSNMPPAGQCMRRPPLNSGLQAMRRAFVSLPQPEPTTLRN